ncbi:MAG: RluA family pseudouridine synthase [bacterium]|mgnify:FL=1|jgi:23S rRNA pseudouridine1911/1915/1917 synthase
MSESKNDAEGDSSATSTEVLVFEVDEASMGIRVDAWIAELTGVSRAQVRRWVDAGRVLVAGAKVRASYKVSLGDSIEARPIEAVEMELTPEAIPLDVLHEDEDLIVIDKPAGLVVHPAPGHPNGTLVNALLHHCGDLAGIGGVLRPGIVHRLDRGTSGVLVAAKNDAAHQALSTQFAEHSIDRVYRALVRGLPRADEGRIDRPIGRHPRDRKRMSVVTKAGRDSITNWRVTRRFRDSTVSELEVHPETGRTHQIRVHLSAAGLPLVGDVIYGRARGRDALLGRPALHAAHLGFEHPRSGKRMGFDSIMPDDLLEWMAELGDAESPE